MHLQILLSLSIALVLVLGCLVSLLEVEDLGTLIQAFLNEFLTDSTGVSGTITWTNHKSSSCIVIFLLLKVLNKI